MTTFTVGQAGDITGIYSNGYKQALGQIALADTGGLTAANEENHRWLGSFSFIANYHLTADGVTLPLLVLTTVVFGCAIFQTSVPHACDQGVWPL